MNFKEETKRITLEYIKTGCIGYQILLKYINGNMKGNLNLGNTKVSYLPENLKVGGYLNLHNTSINSLPEGLTVGGGLYLSNTPISKKYTDCQLRKMFPNLKLFI